MLPGRMDISYYTINQSGRTKPRVCWLAAIFRVKAHLGKEFTDGDSADGTERTMRKRVGGGWSGAARTAGACWRARQMLAAIAAGADAIYAGLDGFNARVSAHGFSDDEFARGCAVAHAHGVRVYVTLNVFVFDDELADAVALGAHAHALGADALIVQMPGWLARFVRRFRGSRFTCPPKRAPIARVPCNWLPRSWELSA